MACKANNATVCLRNRNSPLLVRHRKWRNDATPRHATPRFYYGTTHCLAPEHVDFSKNKSCEVLYEFPWFTKSNDAKMKLIDQFFEESSYFPTTGSFLSPLFSNPSIDFQSYDSHSLSSVMHYQNACYFTYRDFAQLTRPNKRYLLSKIHAYKNVEAQISEKIRTN